MRGNLQTFVWPFIFTIYIYDIYIKKKTKNQKKSDSTRNKARVISKNINNICQVDPTINDFFINLPKQLAFQLSNKTREEIEDILEALIKLTYEQVQIKQESWKIYSTMNTILNSYDNTEQYLEYEMKSQDEAISFLNTEFHERSIEYLSKHITELVSSSEICNIDEGIINDVIDAYISYQGSKNWEKPPNFWDTFKRRRMEDCDALHSFAWQWGIRLGHDWIPRRWNLRKTSFFVFEVRLLKLQFKSHPTFKLKVSLSVLILWELFYSFLVWVLKQFKF